MALSETPGRARDLENIPEIDFLEVCLETPNGLILDAVNVEDAADSQEFWGDKQVAEMMMASMMANEGKAREYYAKKRELMQDKKEIFLVIRKERDLVGTLRIRELNWEEKSGKIAIWVAREHNGQGIATEALSTVRDFALEELGLETLLYMVREDNERSRKVAEKSGWREQPDLREERPDDDRIEILTYEIKKADR